MFSHVTVGVGDLERAGRFYDAVLAPLGIKQRAVELDGGPPSRCWVGGSFTPRFYAYIPHDGRPATAGNGSMVAFLAPSEAAVDQAYAAGIAEGGRDEGPPAIRAKYAPDYYGAYLRDPDGNKVHLVYREVWLHFRSPA